MVMLKLFLKGIAIPLTLIFQKSIDTGKFPDSLKLANVQPVHKKNDRQLKSNYRPISLLPLCGKIFEKIIHRRRCDFRLGGQRLFGGPEGPRNGQLGPVTPGPLTTKIRPVYTVHFLMGPILLTFRS